MDEQIARTRARARTLVTAAAAPLGVVLVVVLGLLGLLALGPLGAVVGLVVALALTAAAAGAAWTGSHRVALAATGAHPADEREHARLHNLVEGLCVGSGLPKPGIWVRDDAAPNALALGRSVDDAAVVVTTGLLDAMTRVELEAVLAHELARIKGGDAAVGALAVTCLGGLPALSPASPATGTAATGPAPSTAPGRLALPLLVAAPLTAALVPLLVPEREESLGDLAAVEITRYPPALVSALAKLAADGHEVAASPVVAHLWLVPPAAAGPRPDAVARVFDTPPPLAHRIEALQEL